MFSSLKGTANQCSASKSRRQFQAETVGIAVSNQIALVKKRFSGAKVVICMTNKNHGMQLRVRETENTARDKPTVNQVEKCEVHRMGIFLYVQNTVKVSSVLSATVWDGTKTLPIQLW